MQGDYDRIKLFPVRSNSTAAQSEALLQDNAVLHHKAELLEGAVPSLTCQLEWGYINVATRKFVTLYFSLFKFH